MLRANFLLFLGFTIASAFNLAPSKKNLHAFNAAIKNQPNDPRACSSAQVTQMQMCYTALLRNYNITAPPYPGYIDFANMRGNYLLYNGSPAMVRVCNWQHDLENCMRDLEADCVNTGTYMDALNQNQTDYANDWFTEWYTLRYACGPGFRELMQNFYCLESVGMYHGDDFQTCVAPLLNQTSVPCDAYNTFLRCYMNVYLPECGPQSQHYVCSVERLAIAVNVPECESQLMQCANMFMSSTFSPPAPDHARKFNLRQMLNPAHRLHRKMRGH